MQSKNFLGIFVNEARLNPNLGTFTYILHRLTGIALAIYLIMHTWVLSSAQISPGTFDERLAMVQTPIFHVLEYLLVAVIFIHMINGLRIIFTDFFGVTRKHKLLFWLGLVVFIALMVWFGTAMVPKVFKHSHQAAQALGVMP
jgi:succinate dehydrogenase / fumarate reductase cytochrome b subunit